MAGRLGSGRKGHRPPGPRKRGAQWLLRWARLAGRSLALPIRPFPARHWRPVVVIALAVLASQPLAQSSAPPEGGDLRLARAPAQETSGSRSQSAGEAVTRKKRNPELVALQWNPASQPSPEPPDPTVSPPIQPPSPPPPPPRVVPLPAAPDGAIAGIATWYGYVDGFGPEDTMADGSQFNPGDPTITAANGWPLGTWLRVCHLGQCIEVQVRDRGAFTHALDLSYAAFSQLAPPSTGVIPVTIWNPR